MPSVGQRLAAEFIGTAFLLAIVVGSGIMAERLSGGNDALALLANSIATGAGLYALILTLEPISAHINPAVTLLAGWRRAISWELAIAYVAIQIAGALLGTLAAHAMFHQNLVQSSAHDRSGWSLAFSEVIATCGLLAVVILVPARKVAGAVAMYITAAYWFTASTSFANPAVTIARALTGTFTGISWPSVPWFIGAQLAAAAFCALAAGRRGGAV
jgi:glycerol uptake facilitator-like aquaporin